ncbi:MAG: DmsE family decaheme c-type cytochrome [Ignavibacteriaceae bacterium]|nr:DmsE family decaheme c-type cytochrome [Ignavibacteriaceae bacterium]
MKIKLLFYNLVFILAIAFLVSQSNSQNENFWVKLNPAFSGATFVMDKETCVTCHDGDSESYSHTIHSRVFEKNPGNTLEASNCESCHGPRSYHIEDPDNKFSFTEEQYSLICQQCHQGGDMMSWKGSLHNNSEVGCISCHSVMEKKSDKALLSKESELDLCATCHSDVKAKAMRMSSHPIMEGKVNCSSCHNVHGSSAPGMLVKATTNETCYSCHQEKRGPFIWEHSPVREDCLTCHDPHGSNNKAMLVTQNASLCISCHQYGGHINEYRYNRVSTPYGDGCVNCHTTIHGSNHPSGVKFTR